MREFGRVRPDEQLARWGSRQHRQVTSAQLRAVGWDKDAVARRVAAGRLHPVFAEVYSLGGPPQTDRELWMAATLTFGPGTKLSHSAAAELYGLLRYPLRELHVITPTARRPRDGICTHHRSGSVSWRYVDGIPVISPARTVLDCAATVRNPKAYRRIVRQAQVEGLASHAQLLALAARSPGVRGVARLRRELAAGPSPTRSVMEDEVLELFRAGGVPIPNHAIDGDEVDLYFPELNVALEVDGPPHDNPTAKADDEAKRRRIEAKGVRLLRVS